VCVKEKRKGEGVLFKAAFSPSSLAKRALTSPAVAPQTHPQNSKAKSHYQRLLLAPPAAPAPLVLLVLVVLGPR
jgi:hypothetical protein